MDTKDTFRDELVNIQKSNHYSDSKMAELMGCSRSLYQATRKGKVSVGIKILQGGLNAFPQLRNVGVIFANAIDAPTPTEKPQNKILRFFCFIDDLLHSLANNRRVK